MSLTLKLASLAIKTLAKPVGNSIKSRAREHELFRKRCIAFAQGLHRVDMRMRLGILHDSAAQERMYAREAAEAAAKKKEAETPTVKTEAQQKAADAEAAEDKTKKPKDKEKPKFPNIRPLPEARAIDLGANFIAETFIFAVAAGLLVFERWWSRRKENKKDEHVIERLQALEDQTEAISYLEAEIQRLRTVAEAREIMRKEEEQNAGKGPKAGSVKSVGASKQQTRAKASTEVSSGAGQA